MLAAASATMAPHHVVGLRKNHIRTPHHVMKSFLQRLAHNGYIMPLHLIQQCPQVRPTICA